MRITGAQAIIEGLKKEGVELVFGYPGGSVVGLYDALYQANFPHVLTRHEQGAVHAADGYARVTGKVGVCFATSGPGATNLITGIATANMDSVPLVAITGQVSVSLIGKDSFQEADMRGITTPITKHNYLVKKVEELPRVIKEAFYIARTGRPGPVVIEVAKDVLAANFEFHYPESVELRGYRPLFAGDDDCINQVLEEMKSAKKPLIFVGGGVSISDTVENLSELVNHTNFPAISSLMGLGCISPDYTQYLGMVGMHGTYAANMATTQCDLLLGIGVRFDDRVTGMVEEFAPKAKIIHFDIDPAEINKNVRADIRVIADLKWALPVLLERVKTRKCEEWQEQVQEWCEEVLTWNREKPLGYDHRLDLIMPQSVVEKLSAIASDDAVIVTDVGQHQMWAAQFYKFRHGRSFITSGGLGTMGYGLPAAIGAKLGLPQTEVFLITGDGSIMMNCQELATAANMGLPIKILLFNNEVLGMVYQWQRLFFGERYSHTSLKGHTDFVKLAEAMGVAGLRVTTPQELDSALAKALEIEGPVLIDIKVPETEDVLPMVPAGARLDQMILGGK